MTKLDRVGAVEVGTRGQVLETFSRQSRQVHEREKEASNTATRIYCMLLGCTLERGEDGEFYVTCCLSQEEKM